MVKIKDCKMPKSCYKCEFLAWFNAEDKDETVYGCVLTPASLNSLVDIKYGLRTIDDITKRPNWCRLKRSLF